MEESVEGLLRSAAAGDARLDHVSRGGCQPRSSTKGSTSRDFGDENVSQDWVGGANGERKLGGNRRGFEDVLRAVVGILRRDVSWRVSGTSTGNIQYFQL